ncbi:aldose 1-epimerase family protein [Cellulomonas denverensis]|uniref:Aldose 1-epimerase family protein n=1 Tax=Cellulomonas denverensis TaxID=264297 RepID=A0A7X6KUR1_9CELL|nr:aldose 1-epimerase family protein [Cellulomonas denverensis]NKY22592.1 aldose 1-epimerase family protein [Cellulomonas denverensis]
MNIPFPSGQQYTLVLGDQRAVIAEVGASVREYAVGGRDVVLPFAPESIAPAFSGAVLAPWPNRLADGQYTWLGVEHQVALTEPDRGNALHGLVAQVRWTAVQTGEAAVTLRHDLVPTQGYPFPLRLEAEYTLTADRGLTLRVAATNLGDRPAPYGVGFHPWLSPGDATVDDCTLRVDAATIVTVDDRLLPTGTAPLTGADDRRTPQPLAGVALDDAFLDVNRDADGLAWIVLGSPDGHGAAVWMDGSMDTWQVCTGNGIPAINRRGVAAEPMSCIADAFRTGERLIRIEPGAAHTVTWGMTLV